MTDHRINRRELLKTLGLATGASLIGQSSSAAPEPSPLPALPAATTSPVKTTPVDGQEGLELGTPPTINCLKPPRPVTAVVIGAGNRGNLYASYARSHPEEWKIVGVAEPIPYRNERMAKTYGVDETNRFVTWEHVFEKPKFADVCIITTPDHLHYGPAMAALELGYDLLLEKVVAQTWKECRQILDLANRKGRVVAVCHVLRYAPYFRQLRHVVRSGRIGDIVSVQHLEPVEHIHMSHSFVRGNWRNAEGSNPMILSKSCHDLDILRWIIDRPCRKVTSFGSLRLFRKEMAPEGSTPRCTDGCAAEATCPFSALKIYLKRRTYLGHLKCDEYTGEKILAALKEGPYGRCVYRCDNDVVDHQITNLEFEDGVTAAFSMESLTSYAGRRTRIMGTKGDIVGDEHFLDVHDFAERKQIRWDVRKAATNLGGHGGGDFRLVRDFVQAVFRKDPSLLTSTLDASMESHLMGFRAEESRLKGGELMEVDLNL
jgi:predicted dehydrogenase